MLTAPSDLMRTVDPFYLLIGLVVGLAFALITLVSVAITDKAQREFALKIIETIIVSAIGAVLARAFASVLVWLGHDRPEAIAFIWHLFLGVLALPVDIVAIVRGSSAYSADPLLWTAFGVGAVVGGYDAIYRTRNWRNLTGELTFLVDLTWGLAMTAHAAAILLINRLWGTHEPSVRENDHVFAGGMRIKSGFAFTQGHVISDYDKSRDPGGDLLVHERTHVLQNRIFGPLFLATYAGWLVFWVLPGLIFDIVGALAGWIALDEVNGGSRRVTLGDGLMWWPYYNNPWEVWGYKNGGSRDPAQVAVLRWPTTVVVVFTILLGLPYLGLLGWLAKLAFIG
jgi:hypothetical protein